MNKKKKSDVNKMQVTKSDCVTGSDWRSKCGVTADESETIIK